MKTRTQSKTYQMGAAHERQAVLAYLRRLARRYGLGGRNLDEVIKWMEGRTKRFNAREGGLQGRKRRAAK